MIFYDFYILYQHLTLFPAHSGNKFCVLVSSGPKVTPIIYIMVPDKLAPILVGKIESGAQLNTVCWAPQGGWLTVFGLNTPNGHVFFIDASGTEPVRSQMIEHISLNQVIAVYRGPTIISLISGCMGSNRALLLHVHICACTRLRKWLSYIHLSRT